MADSLALGRQTMTEASRRVQVRWGSPCPRAAATPAHLEAAAARSPAGEVRVAGSRRP